MFIAQDTLVHKLADSNIEVIRQLNSVEKERNMLETSLQEALDEIDSKNQIITSFLQSQLKASENSTEQGTVTDVNCKSFEDDINYYRNRVANIQSLFEEAKTRLYEMSTENQDLKRNLDLKDEEIVQLTEKHVSLLERATSSHERQQHELQERRIMHDNRMADLEAKFSEHEKLQNSLDTLLASKTQMAALMSEKEYENDHLNQIIANMTATIDQLSGIIDEKNVEISELTQRCDELDQQRMEIEETMMDELVKLSSKANVIRGELEKQLKEKDAIIEQIRSKGTAIFS